LLLNIYWTINVPVALGTEVVVSVLVSLGAFCTAPVSHSRCTAANWCLAAKCAYLTVI
jgi:hypothetical protein